MFVLKKVLLLGGNYVQQTATLAAKRLGYHVISVDYLPDNPAHKFADEYHNISTIDKEAVLALAREKQIDGIVSYASDVSAPTAAYVAEALGLPTNPYESVMILTHKDRFRKFMRENDLPMPAGDAFTDYGEALAFARGIPLPAVVKPVDSSGSKGVTKLTDIEDFPAAWEEALRYSISKKVIIEQFIRRKGYQIDGDIFVVDGKIRFWGICDQHHDDSCAPYTPAGLSFPPTQDAAHQQRARDLIQKILSLLHMTMGAYNIEYIVDESGEVYILEIGPRNGGNLIPDTLEVATGVSLAEYTVKQAVGDDVSDLRQAEPLCCATSYVVHATQTGTFDHLEIGDAVKPHIVRQALTVKPGDPVERFRNASNAIGMMILKYDSIEELCEQMDNMNDYIRAVVR